MLMGKDTTKPKTLVSVTETLSGPPWWAHRYDKYLVDGEAAYLACLQVVEAVDHAQVHGAGAPQLLIHCVQRRMHHKLVQVLRPLLQMMHTLHDPAPSA